MTKIFAKINTKEIPSRIINEVHVHRSGDNDRIVKGEAISDADRTIVKDIFSIKEGDMVEYEFQDEYGKDHGAAKVKSIEYNEEKIESLTRIKYKLTISKV